MDPSMDDPMSDEEDGDNSRASGGGGAMDDDVLEGEQIAEEDVYEYGDPNDPLDRVLDVYLAEELEDNLYLLQYPMRPADRALNAPHAAKVKVANHLLEVEHAIEQGGKHFDNNAPPQLRQATQKHAGSRVRPATNFAFGVVRNNEFHLTPVHATMQMRPLFDHIDDAKALEIEMDLDDVDDGGAKAAAGRPQQVSFKKKESERATAARKSTYAYKKSIEDAEPWLPLEIYDQNDQISLDEFSRMFFQPEGQASKQKQATAKEFPAVERYLRGLDYIEEYDENGESFSVDGRGRSQNSAIDLITPGTSTYSPVKIPETPLKQLPRDAKILGYLKLAHLVPFSMLLDVTGCSAASALGVLSADGARAGWLVRGNWAARAQDVWSGGPSQAADCLSVAQFLLHRYGAVSRPDLKRRFPDLDPVLLKKLLSNIAELDTIGRRWVPKLKDGISFGLTYRSIVDLEEDRWALQEISLRKRLGEEILAPPTCQVFESFTDVLDAMSGAPSAMTYPVRPRSDDTFYSPPAPPLCTTRRRGIVQAGLTAMGRGVTMTTSGDSFDVKKDDFDGDSKAPTDLRYRPSGGVPMEEEGNGKGKGVSEAVPTSASPSVSASVSTSVSAPAVASSSAPVPAPEKTRRHFRPRKRVSPKVATGRGAKTASGGGIKQEHGSSQGREGCNAAGDHVTPPPYPQPSEITTNDENEDLLREPDVFSSSAALAAIAALDSHGMQDGGGGAGAGDAGLVQAPAVEEGVVRVRGPDGNGVRETKENVGEVELDDDDDELDEGGGSRGSQALGGCNGRNEAFSGLAAAKEEPIEGRSDASVKKEATAT